MPLGRIALVLAAILCGAPAAGQDAQFAVAANFTAAAQDLAAAFGAETGYEIGLSFGATGQLYTQITQGAPFAAFLAADAERPTRLVAEGLADGGTRFTYAVGRLALYTAEDGVAVTGANLEGGFARLAIAEPATAPYGAAAIETLAALGQSETVADKLVVGQNIAQTFQFVATGNAKYGFVALSQMMNAASGSHWLVPQDLHAAIVQDAVLIEGGEGAEIAARFLDFMQSDQGRAIIESHGYSTPAPETREQ